MAEVFAPFPIQRTMCNLTFYVIEGRNFVRKKSSLTRRKVLYSPQFERTRHYAGLMGIASKIGSNVYNALPEYWRQGWMYRSFTGEVYTMLRARKSEEEIEHLLLQQYVEPVVGKDPKEVKISLVNTQPKRSYRKLNNEYWKRKTIKSNRRKKHKERTLHNAGLLGRASKIGSKLYARLPRKYARRSNYQYLTGLAFKLLKQEISEEDILAEILATLPFAGRPDEARSPYGPRTTKKKRINVVSHQKGRYFFIPSLHKRIPRPVMALPEVRFCSARTG